MAKSIDIKIGSTFNSDGVLAANKGLARLAQDVKAANSEMRRATMRAEMSVNSYAENADKAVRAMGGGYKTLEEQLAELGKSHTAMGEKATAAGTAAKKSALGLEMAMGLAKGSTEQTAKAMAMLSQKIPLLGKMGAAAFGAWGAAISAVFSLLSALKDLVVEVFNLKGVSKEVHEMSAHFLDLRNEAEQFAFNLDEAAKSASKQAKIFEDEANAITKMTKAQNEFNRAQELSLAKTEEQKNAINAKWDSANAEADEKAAQDIRDNKRSQLQDEEMRLSKSLRAAERRAADYVESGKNGAKDWAEGWYEEQDNIDAAKSKLEENRHAQEMLDEEERVAELMIETRKQKEINAANEAAAKQAEAAQKAADEKAKADAAAAKKAEADRLAAVEAEKKAREKMEADLHAQRVDNAKAEVEASTSRATTSQDTISRAQTEFDKAFGMYRSEDHGASVIAEERDYAADYKQLQKDANRYGGKWRIDELSSLIAAGDTRGQQAKLEEWRKSSRFTPEVESMVRAAAADQTKTTAEDELRKLNAAVENHNQKLDALLTMKGGD